MALVRPPTETTLVREAAEGLGLTTNEIVSGPPPDALPVMVRKPALLETVHGHPGGAAMPKAPPPAAAGSSSVAGLR